MNRKIMLGILAMVVLTVGNVGFAAEVYATKNGKKFHKADCEFIKDRNAVKVDDSDASKKGLKPCGACFKQQNDKQQK